MSFILREYQKEAVDSALEFFNNGKKYGGLIVLPTGCLTGDTMVQINNRKNSKKIKLSDAYLRFNQLSNSNSNWNFVNDIKTRSFIDKTNTIQLNDVEDILYSGVKEVIKIILEDGKEIKLTKGHLVMTISGWITAKNLLNKMVMIDGTPLPIKSKVRQKKKYDSFYNIGENHPFSKKIIDKRDGSVSWRIEIHRAKYEMMLNGFENLEDYKSFIKTGGTPICYDPKLYDIHHIDNDHYNNEPSNLIHLTKSEHRKLHSKENKYNFNQGQIAYSKCIDIKEIGFRKTYDICCKKPNNNFIANGIVVHNSGKSLVIASIANQLDSDVLIFQPSQEILKQNYEKFLNYGGHASIYSASFNSKQISKVTFATIGSVRTKPEYFKRFKYIIIDECFPAGTLIDGKPIETLKPNEFVNSFNHKKNIIEPQKIISISKREYSGNYYKVIFDNGKYFICTENHPIYTKELGYLSAKELYYNKDIIFTLIRECVSEPQNNKTLRNLRDRVQKKRSFKERFYLLFKGVCENRNSEKKIEDTDEVFSLRKSYSHFWGSKSKLFKNGKGLLFERMLKKSSKFCFEESKIKTIQRPELQESNVGENEEKQSNVDSRGKRKNDKINARENLFVKRGERRADKTTVKTSFINEATDGICNKNKNSKRSFPIFAKLLQSRFGISKRENSDRSGWANSQTKKMEVSGCEKNKSFEFLRMGSIEIYEQGSRRKPDGVCEQNYVYNLEIENNHNYFANKILVHNCHFVNAKQGMYKEFLKVVGEKVLGLTATPYRLSTDGFGGSILKFLTRTRPRVFEKVIYYVQNSYLFETGFLAKLQYYKIDGFDSKKLTVNSTGADYTDKSVINHFKEIQFDKLLKRTIRRLLEIDRKNILIFTRFVEEAEQLKKEFSGIVEIVSANTPSLERKIILKNFKKGKIKAVANVGILTTGFDFPELETIIIARPTRSLALYYQMIGRGIRIHPDKKLTYIIDMCDNFNRFGKVEDLEITKKENSRDLWMIKNSTRVLTNVYFE